MIFSYFRVRFKNSTWDNTFWENDQHYSDGVVSDMVDNRLMLYDATVVCRV